MKNRAFSKAYKNEIYTGQEYLESLNDGREVWFDGQRIKDIASHPAFRNAARSVARFYDIMHDPAHQEDLLLVDQFDIVTHKFFAPSYSNAELNAARHAIAISQRINYGWMGRTPDYKAAFMAHLADNAEFYHPDYRGNAIAWYKKYARKAMFLNHVLVDPPVDRSQERINVRDVFISVEKEDDKGIYVSGAKMVATGSMLTHATFFGIAGAVVGHMQKDRDEDMAVVFIADMNTKGMKMVCRPSYEMKAGSPLENPLSGRYDENDAVIIMDNAFIPWENVLVYRDVERCKSFFAQSGFFNRFNLQGAVRQTIKLEFAAALLEKGVECSGTSQFRGIQAAIGEILALRNTVWGLTTAMVHDTVKIGQGGVIPNEEMAATIRYVTAHTWDQVRDIYQRYLAGAPIYTISSEKDFLNEELQPFIKQYYRGTGVPAEERIKLFKLIWDSMFSEFAGRHALYERNYSGNHDMQRIDILTMAERNGSMDQYRKLVKDCLNDYNYHGWTKCWIDKHQGVESKHAAPSA